MNEPIIMKRCCTCKETKEAKDFSKNKSGKYGLSHNCTICKKKADKKYYYSKKGQIRFKNYALTETFKEYKKSESYKESHRRGSRKYSRQHPDKIKAHSFVNRLVKTGKLANPKAVKCSCCPDQAEHYHHNLGYAKVNWANIIPVCHDCHFNIHKE